MDRQRIIDKLRTAPITVGNITYKFKRELGRGGNGVALLCGSPGNEDVVAKVYVPPDSRDLDDRALERFKNEVALTTKLRHPNIVPSLGAAVIDVGAYRLPFYLMPVASSTLRSAIRVDTDPDDLERRVKLFLRACYGVACLHHHGVVHRDLKPENILVGRKGEPWIADLGIAHVNPDFVSVGLKTIASEKLLNRDYYAPEQRFGQANDVTDRADIYALGCILYELLTSIPPVRSNSPNPSSIASILSPFDSIWQRMTAWKAEDRHATVEEATEEVAIALGWVLAALRGASGVRHPDLKLMTKLLRSRNEAQRQQGIEIAVRLGQPVLSELHSLLGHEKREVRNSAAQALGQIADKKSLPFLVAALYGNTDKPGLFRPAADNAADAIARYPLEDRLHVLRIIDKKIRPSQVGPIIAGLPTDTAYEAVLALNKRELLLLDYADTELALLVQIDEDRAWPGVKDLVNEGADYKIREVLKHLSPRHSREVINAWVRHGAGYVWYVKDQIECILGMVNADTSEKLDLLQIVEHHLQAHRDSDERAKLLKQVHAVRKTLASSS